MDPTLWQMTQPILAGQLRHILTVLAGALIMKGALQSDQQGAFVTIGMGVASWAATATWSWWQKTGQAKVAQELARLKARATMASVQQAMQNKVMGTK